MKLILPALVVLIPLQVPASAALPPPGEIRTSVLTTIDETARRHKLILDPRVRDQIAGSVSTYVGNFCTAGEAGCSKAVRRGPVLGAAVEAYINEVRQLPAGPVRVVGDRLANGMFPRAGIPSAQKSELGLVRLPTSLRKATLTLRFAGGELPLPGWQPLLLAVPGSIQLDATDAKVHTSWKVTVVAGSTLALEKLGPDAVQARPISLLPTAFCSGVPEPPYRGPFEAFNWGRARIGESAELRTKNEAPILHTYAVDVALTVDAASGCTRDCQAAISLLFADAIATWKIGCERCERDALVMLKTPAKAWLDWRLARRLRLLATGNTVTLDLMQSVEGDGGGGLAPLTDLDAEPEVIKQLCAVPANAARWVQPTQSLVCPSAIKVAGGVLRAEVKLLAQPGTCGPEAIACGLPDAGIEISFTDYRFSMPNATGGSPIIAGRASSREILNMRTVVLHEVGHWFGVPHAQIDAANGFLDIMSEAYGQGKRCVSPQSLRMAANAGDLRWPFRVAHGGALSAPLPRRTRSK